MVQFDYKGEKGYGHVIEGISEAKDVGEEEGREGWDQGTSEFPTYDVLVVILHAVIDARLDFSVTLQPRLSATCLTLNREDGDGRKRWS
jgi:hypothetical protein